MHCVACCIHKYLWNIQYHTIDVSKYLPEYRIWNATFSNNENSNKNAETLQGKVRIDHIFTVQYIQGNKIISIAGCFIACLTFNETSDLL